MIDQQQSQQRPAGRYPQRRRRRPLVIVAVAVVAAIGLGWLIWAAAVHSRPTVSGAIHVWKVASDSSVTFTLTVERPDPSVAATCRVIAQATNFETVGEKTITVGPGTDRLTDVHDSLRTIRRATSVSMSGCTVQG
ncbi:DUF4307 domain-containing protein [Microlunatus soli]|uniref:DUF4307 domain-containing protein n=1 Tax=Microlunatus soli TaxID=630515 RepID=A0A1H1QNN5_9ACTN|nr:DUF4307 domain-containing protein [Microlunatus soli]SDS25080.1 protein of unknown function [Microlunatus soli]